MRPDKNKGKKARGLERDKTLIMERKQLQDMMKMPGWQMVQGIINKNIGEQAGALSTSNDLNDINLARGICKGLGSINTDIETIIRAGENAMERAETTLSKEGAGKARGA